MEFNSKMVLRARTGLAVEIVVESVVIFLEIAVAHLQGQPPLEHLVSTGAIMLVAIGFLSVNYVDFVVTRAPWNALTFTSVVFGFVSFGLLATAQSYSIKGIPEEKLVGWLLIQLSSALIVLIYSAIARAIPLNERDSDDA